MADSIRILEEEFENTNMDDKITHPFDPRNIKITNAVISLSSIVNRLSHNEIDLNPDFQRNADLWDRKRMSSLIESILLRLPLPIFYFDVSNADKWVVIDGLQRLSTIKKFIVEKRFKLKNLEFLSNIENKSYDELNRAFQRIIEETQINTYQIEAQTPKEVKYSIFNRINTGGMMLNAQEVRQALNQKNNGVNFLKSIVQDDIFKKIVYIKSKRMIDRELVLRFIAFSKTDYIDFCKGTKSYSTFLDKTMEYIDSDEITTEELNLLKNNLLKAITFIGKIFSRKEIFNKKIIDDSKTGTLNRSLFEVWTVLISKLNDVQLTKILENKERLISRYKVLLASVSFNDSITKGTNDKKAVKIRFESLDLLLREVLISDK